MPTCLITGANRGVGLELTRLYLRDGWTVHACARDPAAATALTALAGAPEHGGRVILHRLDVTDAGAIASLAAELAATPIDHLVNNAAVVDNYGLGASEGKDDPDIRHFDFDFWDLAFKTNLQGPARMVGAFLDHVAAGDAKMIVFVSSGLGSIAQTEIGGRYAYRTTKAGLNMLARGFAAWLRPHGIAVVAVTPGWTRTDAGGPRARNSVEDAVGGMYEVIRGLTLAESGTFWDWDGTALPW